MQINRELLEKYHAGRCTPEEVAAVEAWMETGDGGNEMLHLPAGEDKQAHLAKIWRAIEGDIALKAPRTRLRRIAWYLSAACLAGLGIALYFLPTGQEGSSADETTRWRTVFNDGAGVRELKLPDGSVVALNVGAVVRYPENYRSGRRALQLEEGEALFDIAGAPEHPFSVKIGSAEVQVLGTSFNIRRSVRDMEVTLQTGKVRFTSPGHAPVVMRPGEQLVSDTSGAVTLTALADAGNITAWRTGELVFGNTPLPAVLDAVSRCYSIRFEADSARIRQLTFTGQFRQQTLETVLSVLSSATDIRFSPLKEGVFRAE